ncbi:CHASE3 domain-containing protein [Mycobacterium sp. NPDC048908]|uniref:CHASE3 domain-containing protein n=1 Tax=Mycobacterium sp. NPDC048908 TaxID=3364292 RepID=UPI00372479AB
MRVGLTTRLLVATGVVAAIVTAAFVFLFFAMASVHRARDMATHSADVSYVARDARRMLGDMETSQRGYIITGEQNFLIPWETARQKLPERLTTLRTMVDDPAQADRAAALQAGALAYVNDYAVPLVAGARRGDSWVRGIPASDEGKQRMDALRRQLDEFLMAEFALSNAEQVKADRDYQHATIMAAVGLGASLLVTALSTLYLARGVVGPVRRTARMAERLSAGDLQARVPETGKAEIAVLERNFNAMGESLQHGRAALARITDEQAALRRVATRVAQGRPAREIFTSVTEEVGLLLGADITRLLRFEPDGSATVAAAWTRTGNPVAVGTRIDVDVTVAGRVRQSGLSARATEESPPGLSAGTYSAVGAPIMVSGSMWGAMTALSPLDRPLPDDTETHMVEFTDLVGTAIANVQAHADLVASRARIVTAADETRRRIERDLHDGIQQRLVALALKLRLVEPAVPAGAPELRKNLAALDAGLLEAVEELRELSRGIHPAILSKGGLGPALRSLSRRCAVPIELDVRVEDRLPENIEGAAYYVAAEALTNAAKHANASVVSLCAVVEDGRLVLTVEDDGDGGADPSRGSGLVGLTDRVEAVGGTLTVTSLRGEGTTLRAELPWQSAVAID